MVLACGMNYHLARFVPGELFPWPGFPFNILKNNSNKMKIIAFFP